MLQKKLDNFIDEYHHMYSERNDVNKIVITKEYVEKNKEKLIQMVRLFALYPDYLIDIITQAGSYFKLFFYQRVFLRVLMRYKYVSGTFPRAYSKSFLNFIALILKGMFLPLSKGFVCADTKQQAAQIVEEKVAEVFFLFPFFTNELKISDVDFRKQKWGNFGGDYVEITTKNNSKLDVVNTGNAGRGGRRHFGTLEEFALADGDKIQNVVIPLMNVNRKTAAGKDNPTEPHAAQTMITTAGYKNTYAHDRTLELLVDMALHPEQTFVFGGDYKIPLMHGLLTPDKIRDKIKASGTYKLETFMREYMSVWSGGSEDSYYSYDMMSKRRKLIKPEFMPENKKDVFYTLSVDVGRFNDETVLEIFKTHTSGEKFKSHLVNIIILKGRHFLEQAIRIKELDAFFEFRGIVVDINGPGAGLADFLIIENESKTGIMYPAYGFTNKPKYAKTEQKGCIRKMYGVEASSGSNSDYYKNAHLMLTLGRVLLLIDERRARAYFAKFKYWNKMTIDKKQTQLIPYIVTTKLQDQLANLKANIESISGNINVQKIKTTMGKDLASAFVYGLWFIALEEDKELKKRQGHGSLGQYSFYN